MFGAPLCTQLCMIVIQNQFEWIHCEVIENQFERIHYEVIQNQFE